MKHLKWVLLLTVFITSVLFAQETTDEHSFTGSIVNKTGHVIRFTLGTSGFWVAITTGDAVHLFWDTFASEKIKLEGLPTAGKYRTICHDVDNLYNGQTIIVNITDKADEGSDFYCSIEPAVH